MIFKRQRDGRQSDHWYCKVQYRGKQILRNTRCTSRADAERFERVLVKALAGTTEQALAAITASSSVSTCPTLGKIVEAFRAAPGDWTPHTRRGYVGSLRVLVESALGNSPAWETRPASVLTADLVYKFRQAVHRANAAADDARKAQAGRSGNTALRSARALFAPQLLEHYKVEGGMALPDFTGFRDAPGFRHVSKEEYDRPSDALIARTLEAIESSRETHRDRYLAVWLALGFGLRKSEAAAVRAGWFVRVAGRMHLELRAVVQPGTPGKESTVTKNGTACPRIPAANGAWDKLAPYLRGIKDDAHILAPDATDTYRGDDLFDEIAAWMRGLGWETQKAFHEWRALAGCEVAMRDGLLVARDWLRHSSVTTTERNYGRYIRTQVTDAPLVRDTVSDTKSEPLQSLPNPVSEVAFGGGLEVERPAQVIVFPGHAPASPTESSVARP